MADVSTMVFNDELVEESAFVLLVKMKKKKKRIDRIASTLLVTRTTVGIVNPKNIEDVHKQFPKTCLRKVLYDDVEDDENQLYTIEIQVDVDGTGRLRSVRLEFASENAKEDMKRFIRLFDECIQVNERNLAQLQQSMLRVERKFIIYFTFFVYFMTFVLSLHKGLFFNFSIFYRLFLRMRKVWGIIVSQFPSFYSISISLYCDDNRDTNKNTNVNINKRLFEFCFCFTFGIIRQANDSDAPNANNQATRPQVGVKTAEESNNDLIGKIDQKTLEYRCWLLETNPEIKKLYEHLVTTSILHPNEFFQKYDPKSKKYDVSKKRGMRNRLLGITSIKHYTWSLMGLMERYGITFEQEKTDDNDGNNNDKKNKKSGNNKDNDANDVKTTVRGKIRLTKDQIMEIFIHLPFVELCFEKYVKNKSTKKWTESEFWYYFVNSAFFKKETSLTITSHSEKKTEIDRLLELCKKELKKANRNTVGSNSNGNNNNASSENVSYAAQIAFVTSNAAQEIAAEAEEQRKKSHKRHSKQNNQDIEMNGKHNSNNNNSNDRKDDDSNINNNEDLLRGNQSRRLMLDPSIDLSSTVDSFTEWVEDPTNDALSKDNNSNNIMNSMNGNSNNRNGNNNNNNSGGNNQSALSFLGSKRNDTQAWFANINKHGTLLLQQSLKSQSKPSFQTNNGSSGGSGHHHGRKSKLSRDEIKMNMNDSSDIFDNDYHARLVKETELEELQKEKSPEYIELRIKDQSVYWGENQSLTDLEKNEYNKSAIVLFNSYQENHLNLPNLQEINDFNDICISTIAGKVLMTLSDSNYLQAKRQQFEKKNDQESKKQARIAMKMRKKQMQQQQYNMNIDATDEQEQSKKKSKKNRNLIIFTEKQQYKVSYQNLEQIETFSKPMILLITHYWACFPANKGQWRKAGLIIDQLKRYDSSLQQYGKQFDAIADREAQKESKRLGRKVLPQRHMRPILLNLTRMLGKVFKHYETKKKELIKKTNLLHKRSNGAGK